VLVERIREIGLIDIERFLPHARRHAEENGDATTPLFATLEPWDGDRIRNLLVHGLAAGLGSPGWCRVWTAEADTGEILGHLGLRARGESGTEHRALVNFGVLNPHRRRGVATRLLQTGICWAKTTSLAWLDAQVFAENKPTLVLLLRHGFKEVGRTQDMFRIGGQRIDDVALAFRVRSP